MNIINLAHGSMIMMGAYTTYSLFRIAGIDPFLSIPISVAIFFLVGFMAQKYIVNRIMMTSVLMSMLMTYGFELILVNFVLVVWKGDYRSVITGYSQAAFVLGDVVIPYVRVAIFIVGFLLTLLLYLFMTYTKTGNAIRATALDKEAALLVGVDIKRVYALTYGIASALAAAAGSLLPVVYTISPAMEGPLLGKAFIIAVLGGLGNTTGAIVGGLTLAIAESLGVVLLGPSYQVAVGFFMFLLVLVFRPHGLVGKKFYAEL